MKGSALIRLIFGNVSRAKKNFMMSAFGILVGISTFVFFVGLGEGIRNVVLGKIFIVDQVEVVPPRFDTGFGQISSGATIDDGAVDAFREIDGVEAVFPKMKFTFPARAFGGKRLFGRNLWAEIIADGISPTLVRSELPPTSDFVDRDILNKCSDDDQCGDGRTCEAGQCAKIACTYTEKTQLSACPGESYCARDTKRCELPIPFLVSHHLLELYNGSLATALSGAKGKNKMPKLSKNTVLGFQLSVTLGRSFLGRSAKSRPVTRRIKLVGFSDKAITVGITVPIAYVKRLNTQFSGGEAGQTYHSAIVRVGDQTAVPQVVSAIKESGFSLATSTQNAERAANIIRTVESIFALISFVIVFIAAVNISQMFYMLIYQRKRELGLFRALGASRHHVRMIILGESAFIGVFGGLLGAGCGFGVARFVDWIAQQLPEFPYKPDTFFSFPTWVWGAAVGISVLFCLFGAFFPANAAASREPAAALTE
ncbi:MAG: ABC transporter permease [Myxococcota bacterium]|nr:ABC transporter permease [Myxococcota bacterium]